jgi:type IV pilus assembly protein PilX
MISLHKQNGIALFIAMLILPLLLVLGVLVMNNSFLGLKIASSRAMQGESNITLDGAAYDILHQSDSAQIFASALSSSTFSSALFNDVNSTVTLNGELNCKRRLQASGSNFKCKYLQVNLTHSYGREKADGVKWAINAMGLGVEQPIIVE